jgi:hypothetical protein
MVAAALGVTGVAVTVTVAIWATAAIPPAAAGKPGPRTSAKLLIATTASRPIITVAAAPATRPPIVPPAVRLHPTPPPAAAYLAVSSAPYALTLYAQGTGVTTPATQTPTFTTIPSIRNQIPVPPSTVPLQTRAMSTHISPLFPALSGAGFFIALIMVTSRLVMTRGRRKG